MAISDKDILFEQIQEDHEDFRDHIATVDESGKRIWIYPRKPFGIYTTARTLLAVLLLALLFGMPFLKVKGEPFMLFNVLERKFILFGFYFTPADFHLFVLATLIFVIFVALFTVVYGRLFCGWVCPQTIFMEVVFRKIEYAIEGDAAEQRKLNAAPWTPTKVWKRTLKHGVFFAIAFLISNTFLAYIIGMDQLERIITEPVGQHLGGFVAILIFSGVFYFVFSWMREQVCIAICPYGRLQGVLLDRNSIVVAYDNVRGEPRAKLKKMQEDKENSYGDCIDCKLCIQVCPTGIDIRNGTQLECVNCTACMDACDFVMDKIHKPRKLIRYDSFNGIQSGVHKLFNTRSIAYSMVLLLLIGVEVALFSFRSKLEAIVLRTAGMTYQEVDKDRYSNLYNYQLINKTQSDFQNLRIVVNHPGAEVKMIGHMMDLKRESNAKGAFFVILPASEIRDVKTPLRVEIWSGQEKLESVKTSFMGPVLH